MKNKFFLLSVTLFLFVGLFFIGSFLYKSNEADKARSLARDSFSRLVPDYAPRIGATEPKVFLVEFLDPECETCREFNTYVKMLLNEFEGKIQLVIRYAPFHPNSRFAIKILEASRKQGKYWETLDVLYQYQPQWGSHHHPRPELIWQYLPQAEVDIEKIKEDMKDPSLESRIEQEVKDLTALGVKATPSFFVNGIPLQNFGLRPLRELIMQELEKSED